MSRFDEALETAFRAQADADAATAMRDYMRGQFPFLGLKAPERRALVREVLKAEAPPDGAALRAACRALWAKPEREFQYAALDLLFKNARELDCEATALLERLILTKPWWDTVDALAKLVGEVFRRDTACRDRWLERWRASDDLWLRRCAILFQLAYKDATERELLFDIIRENAGSRAFFIQKAIGWALREYAKTEPEAVEAFVRQTALAPLSRREALKNRPHG